MLLYSYNDVRITPKIRVLPVVVWRKSRDKGKI